MHRALNEINYIYDSIPAVEYPLTDDHPINTR